MTPRTPLIDRKGWIFLAVLAAFCLAVPVLNLAVPEGSGLHLPTYLVSLFGKYLAYALLAVSLDLVWGYCGILSLGHGAFFALGGYAMGMYLMRQIGSRGVYANPMLPDFMVFLNWHELMGMYLMRQIGSRGVYGNPILPDFMVFLNYPSLPWYWHGFDMFWFAALMVLVVPGLLAFCFGWFAFRSRVTGVYLSIITQAMTYALLLGFFRNDFGFGGNNGLTDFKDILGFNVQADGTRGALFALSCLALIVAFLICRAVVSSKLGKVLIAIRDAESRTRFIGYRVESYKLFVFTLSLLLAFFRNDFGFGGNNGLTDFKDILGFNVQAEGTRCALFALSCLALIIAFLICRAVVTSKLGKVLIAIRDAESRTRFIGYRVESYKLFVFTLSACTLKPRMSLKSVRPLLPPKPKSLRKNPSKSA